MISATNLISPLVFLMFNRKEFNKIKKNSPEYLQYEHEAINFTCLQNFLIYQIPHWINMFELLEFRRALKEVDGKKLFRKRTSGYWVDEGFFYISPLQNKANEGMRCKRFSLNFNHLLEGFTLLVQFLENRGDVGNIYLNKIFGEKYDKNLFYLDSFIFVWEIFEKVAAECGNNEDHIKLFMEVINFSPLFLPGGFECLAKIFSINSSYPCRVKNYDIFSSLLETALEHIKNDKDFIRKVIKEKEIAKKVVFNLYNKVLNWIRKQNKGENKNEYKGDIVFQTVLAFSEYLVFNFSLNLYRNLDNVGYKINISDFVERGGTQIPFILSDGRIFIKSGKKGFWGNIPQGYFVGFFYSFLKECLKWFYFGGDLRCPIYNFISDILTDKECHLVLRQMCHPFQNARNKIAPSSFCTRNEDYFDKDNMKILKDRTYCPFWYIFRNLYYKFICISIGWKLGINNFEKEINKMKKKQQR